MSSRDLGEDGFEHYTLTEEIVCAYKIVAFAIESPEKIVGQQFCGYSSLPSYVPLTQVFITKNHEWADEVTERLYYEFDRFEATIGRRLGTLGVRYLYDLSSKKQEFEQIEAIHERQVICSENLLLLMPQFGKGILNSTEELEAGEIVPIDSLSLIRSFSEDPKGPIVIREVFSL